MGKLKVLTLNCNGIRAAQRKGLLEWLSCARADAVMLQELKGDDASDHILEAAAPAGWRIADWGKRKGYAGTALLLREKPDEFFRGFGCEEFDDEGRLCAARAGNLWLMSLYAPSGSASDARQESKERFMSAFGEWMADFCGRARAAGQSVVIAGDMNIARTSLDLKNWKANAKRSGFLPHEREWLDGLLARCGLADAYRSLHPETPGYTWWSARANAKANDVGWRIDYVLGSFCDGMSFGACAPHPELSFSDHCPLVCEIELGGKGL